MFSVYSERTLTTHRHVSRPGTVRKAGPGHRSKQIVSGVALKRDHHVFFIFLQQVQHTTILGTSRKATSGFNL